MYRLQQLYQNKFHTNCNFNNFKGDFANKTNIEALQFDALAGDHFSSFNPDNDETPSKNVTIKNSSFKNLQRGLGTHTGIANSYFENFTIINNTFENITGYAIIATNYKNANILYKMSVTYISKIHIF